jgi:Zn-dependent metalloprotease
MKIKTLSALLLISSGLFAQQKNLTDFIAEKESPNFLKFKKGNTLSVENIVNTYKLDLGLTANDKLELVKKEEDNKGFTHYRYQQYFNGIEVYGAQYLIHENESSVIMANGNLVKGFKAINALNIKENVAVEKAINFIGAEKYRWQNTNEEQLLKKIKNDNNATYFPTATLVLFDKYFTQIASNYTLAYKVEVYAEKPLIKKDVFIDAQTGDVLHSINKIHTTEVTGLANTKYAGAQSIQVDSLSSSSYRLREYARGGGIETYNMLQGTNYGAAVDFTDTDNIWSNVNSQQDEAATDAHWAAEMTFDYFFNEHGRNSYDNAGSILLSYVHYDANYSNAFWDGVRMTYGDGDGTTYTALTSLDVGGHEISHGVTEYSANLVYQNESGALNESFSDIFGTAIEFFADPANGDWFIGEDFDVSGNGFRSMSDPNSVGDPDTYLGNNWEFTAIDNGGVHTNSSVQNYWFYLLSAGGSGTNDNGDAYNITGLGIDTAAAIAYRNLTVYLTQSSEYEDARIGAIQSAEDLYGPCSNAVIETSKAWAAVGVGFPIEDNDLAVIFIDNPTTGCGLTNTENVTVKIRNNGCIVDLLAGDTIPVAFQINGGAIINEVITLTSNFLAGDTLTYTFSATADLSVVGTYGVSAWVNYQQDSQPLNDSIINMQVEHKLQQNFDVSLVEISSPLSGCYLSNAEIINVAIQFLGCDSLVMGTNIDLEYQLDGGTVVNETFVLPNTLYAEDSAFYSFSTPIDLSVNGTHSLSAWSAYSPDVMNINDTILDVQIKNPFPLFDTDTVTFENNIAVLDSTILTDNIESEASISNASSSTGNYALRLTGGDPLNSGITPDLDSNGFWSNNIEFAATAKFCVDASSWSGAYMQFDLRQTMSKVYNLQFGQLIPQASSFRVVVDGTQIGGTYNPITEINDPFTTQTLNLNSYAGTQFEVIFETRMGFSEAADPLAGFPFNSEGDNAYVDNILFSQTPVSINENEIIENVNIYPNPNKGLFVITFESINDQNTTIEIYDMLGNLVMNQNNKINVGFNQLKINISNYPNSIYFVKVVSEKGSYIERVVKN